MSDEKKRSYDQKIQRTDKGDYNTHGSASRTDVDLKLTELEKLANIITNIHDAFDNVDRITDIRVLKMYVDSLTSYNKIVDELYTNKTKKMVTSLAAKILPSFRVYGSGGNKGKNIYKNISNHRKDTFQGSISQNINQATKRKKILSEQQANQQQQQRTIANQQRTIQKTQDAFDRYMAREEAKIQPVAQAIQENGDRKSIIKKIMDIAKILGLSTPDIDQLRNSNSPPRQLLSRAIRIGARYASGGGITGEITTGMVDSAVNEIFNRVIPSPQDRAVNAAQQRRGSLKDAKKNDKIRERLIKMAKESVVASQVNGDIDEVKLETEYVSRMFEEMIQQNYSNELLDRIRETASDLLNDSGLNEQVGNNIAVQLERLTRAAIDEYTANNDIDEKALEEASNRYQAEQVIQANNGPETTHDEKQGRLIEQHLKSQGQVVFDGVSGNGINLQPISTPNQQPTPPRPVRAPDPERPPERLIDPDDTANTNTQAPQAAQAAQAAPNRQLINRVIRNVVTTGGIAIAWNMIQNQFPNIFNNYQDFAAWVDGQGEPPHDDNEPEAPPAEANKEKTDKPQRTANKDPSDPPPEMSETVEEHKNREGNIPDIQVASTREELQGINEELTLKQLRPEFLIEDPNKLNYYRDKRYTEVEQDIYTEFNFQKERETVQDITVPQFTHVEHDTPEDDPLYAYNKQTNDLRYTKNFQGVHLEDLNPVETTDSTLYQNQLQGTKVDLPKSYKPNFIAGRFNNTGQAKLDHEMTDNGSLLYDPDKQIVYQKFYKPVGKLKLPVNRQVYYDKIQLGQPLMNRNQVYEIGMLNIPFQDREQHGDDMDYYQNNVLTPDLNDFIGRL